MILTAEQGSLILAGVAALIAVAALAWALALQRRIARLPGGASAAGSAASTAALEKAFQAQAAELAGTTARTEKLATEVADLWTMLPRTLQRVGVVRFNPFSDTGSDQSFAIAVLDAAGDGLVLSALYSRGSVRIYAKPVAGCRSEYNLSEEEAQAINRAMSPRS